MSEIGEVWYFLFSAVSTVFDLILDVVATGVLVAAVLPFPWRWIETLDDLHNVGNSWKGFCIGHFFLTLVDAIVMPLFLCSLLSPMRWGLFFKTLFSTRTSDLFSRRGDRFGVFCLAMFDLFAIFMATISLLNPVGRQLILCHTRIRDTQSEASESAEWDKTAVMVGCNTLLDLLRLLPVPFILFAPTVWRTVVVGTRCLTLWKPTSRTSTHENDWMDYYEYNSQFLFIQGLHALFDMFTFPFFLLAFCSPWRHHIVRDLIWPPSANPPQDPLSDIADKAGAFNLVVRGDFNYRAGLREDLIYQGFLSLLDYLLMPLILPLFLTYYRYVVLRDALKPPSRNDGAAETTSRAAWGHKELLLILQQFALLVSDVFLLAIPLLLLFVTRFRWSHIAPLFRNWREEGLFLNRNSELYSAIAAEFILLIVDIICLPFLLVVLVTFYRWPTLKAYLTMPIVQTSGLQLHYHILMNFMLVLQDVIYLPFLLVVSLVAWYRSFYSLSLIFPSCFPKEPVSQEPVKTADDFQIIHPNDTRPLQRHSTNQNYQTIESPPVVAVAANQPTQPTGPPPSPPPPPFPYDYGLELSHRADLWGQVFQSFLDIPVLVLMLVLVLTIWRCRETFKSIDEYLSKRRYRCTIRAVLSRNDDDEIRFIIFSEFCRLIRDIFCLLPFFLLIATVYKLPSLLVELIAKYRTRIVTGKTPKYDVRSCHLNYPVGADATMTVRMMKLVEKKKKSQGDAIGEEETVNLGEEKKELKDYRLQILGKEMWEISEGLFGGFLVNVAKSMLPLKLVDGISVVWKAAAPNHNTAPEPKPVAPVMEFRTSLLPPGPPPGASSSFDDHHEHTQLSPLAEHHAVETKSIELSLSEAEEKKLLAEQWKEYEEPSNQPPSSHQPIDKTSKEDDVEFDFQEFELVVTLPTKAVKHTTAAKHLSRFPEQAKFLFQLECKERIVSEGKERQDDAILFRFPLVIPYILPVFQEGKGYFPISPELYADSSSIEIEKTSFVNSFHGIVIKSFLDFLLDCYYFVLFFATAFLNPIRFFQLLMLMLNADATRELMIHVLSYLSLKGQAMNYHLLEYRNSVSKFYNNVAKQNISQTLQSPYYNNPLYYYFSGRYFYYYGSSHNDEDSAEKNSLQLHDLEQYHKLGMSALKDLKFLAGLYKPASLEHFQQQDENKKIIAKDLNLKEVESKFQEFARLHDDVMGAWFQKYGLWLCLNDPGITRRHKDLMNILLAERHDQLVKKMLYQKSLLDDSLEKILFTLEQPQLFLSPEQRQKKKGIFRGWKLGVLSRKTDDNRKIIQYYFSEAVKDFAGFCLFLLLIVTMIRVPALFGDYYADKNRYQDQIAAQQKTSTPSHPHSSSWCSPYALFSKMRNDLSSPVSFLFHVKKQITALYRDLADLAFFLLFTFGMVVTVVSLPSFLVDLLQRNHLSSFSQARRCARYHFRQFWSNLCEFLLLFTAFKTYKILVKSVLYILLLPAAGIAECLSSLASVLGIFFRFFLGFLVSCGLIIGAIVITVRGRQVGRDAGADDDLLLSAYDVNASQFTVVLLAVGMVALLAFLKRRDIIRKRREEPDSGPSLGAMESTRRKEKQFLEHSLRIIPFQPASWNHLLSSLVPLVEVLQMSAVLMYFFWSTLRSNDNSSGSSGAMVNAADTHLQSDHLSVIVYWTTHATSQVEGGPETFYRETYNTSMTIAALLGLLYIILVALPIAYGGESEEFARRFKIQQIRNQSFYHVALLLVSQLLSTWLMAMFLRPLSCLPSSSEDSLELSTSFMVQCGGSNQWSSKVAVVLVVYFLLSLTVSFIEDSSKHRLRSRNPPRRTNNYDYYNHSYAREDDEIINPSGKMNAENALVFYDTTYQVLTKLYAAVMLLLCYVWFAVYPSWVILSSQLALSLVMFLYPLCCDGFIVSPGSQLNASDEDANPRGLSSTFRWVLRRMNAFCTVPSLMPLRSCSFLAIGWTVGVLLLRCILPHHFVSSQSVVFNTEWLIFVGWILLFALAAVLAYWIEKENDLAWQDLLRQQGIQQVVQQLEEIFSQAFVETSHVLSSQQSSSLVASNSALKRGREKQSSAFLNFFRYQLQHAVRSERDLVFLLLLLEENISVEKLSDGFYKQREAWIGSLVSLANGESGPMLSIQGNRSTNNDQNTSSAAVPTTVPRLAYSFEMILNHMAMLKLSLEDTLATTTLSWKVLDVILDFRLPRDCCFVIHSFLLDVKELYHVLFHEVTKNFKPVPLLYDFKAAKKSQMYDPSFYNYSSSTYKLRYYHNEMYGRILHLFSYDAIHSKILPVFSNKKYD